MLTDADRTHATTRLNRHLSPDLQYGPKEMASRLAEINRQVEAWWGGTYSEATRWLASGLDIMFDVGFVRAYGPVESREQLQERFHKMVVDANSQDPTAWSDADIAAGKAWLAASPYTLWRMVEDAREAGISEVENLLFEFARERSDGTSVAKAVEESFRKAVQNWQTAIQRAA